jgi:hypothetical protein
MSDGSKRYAIRVARGLYSDGPRMRAVPLAKAKLWTNIGHVKTHLQGAHARMHYDQRRYPPSARIVEIVLSYDESDVGSVADVLEAHITRQIARDKRDAVLSAKLRLESARRELADAETTTSDADAAFIAAARDDIDWLIARVRELEREVRDFESAADDEAHMNQTSDE